MCSFGDVKASWAASHMLRALSAESCVHVVCLPLTKTSGVFVLFCLDLLIFISCALEFCLSVCMPLQRAEEGVRFSEAGVTDGWRGWGVGVGGWHAWGGWVVLRL